MILCLWLAMLVIALWAAPRPIPWRWVLPAAVLVALSELLLSKVLP